MKWLLGLLVFSLLLVPVVSAEVYQGICADHQEYSTLIGNFAEPNSSAGYGAVDICQICYTCSDNYDGVCPEDFYSGSQRGSCSSWYDADCTGCVTGQVQINDSSGAVTDFTSLPATIYTNYSLESPNVGTTPSVAGSSNQTDGTFNVSVTTNKAGGVYARATLGTDVYQSPKVAIGPSPPTRGGSCVNVGPLIMEKTLCENDCTFVGDDDNICQAACEGTCTFPSNAINSSTEVKAAVDGERQGTRIELHKVIDPVGCTATTYFMNACNGPIQNETNFIVSGHECAETEPDANIRNLVTRVQRVRYAEETGTRPLELVVMHWSEN